MTTATATAATRPAQPKCVRPGCPRLQYHRPDVPLCEPHARQAGLVQEYVPNSAAVDFLQPWVELGFSPLSLVRTAGLSNGQYTLIKDGSDLQADTFRRLVDNMDPMQCMTFPGWMVMRRLFTMRGAGLSRREIIARTGVTQATVDSLTHTPRRLIKRRNAIPIFTLYDEVRTQPVKPPTPPARRAGYPVPFAWDNIDDPDEGRGSLHPVPRSLRVQEEWT